MRRLFSVSIGLILLIGLYLFLGFGLDMDTARPAYAVFGNITTVAGNGIKTYGGDGGPAISASLNRPLGITFNASGDMFIADAENQRIRKVTQFGNISTVAGDGYMSWPFGRYAGDGGLATLASLNWPHTTAFDSSGEMYITDQGNGRIRKVSKDGIISTVVSGLNHTAGIAFDAAGNLFITDTSNCAIYSWKPDAGLTVVAGNGIESYDGDGGPATFAGINHPTGICFDKQGNMLFADTMNNRIRKVTTFGNISTVAGNGTADFAGDGGQAVVASIYEPTNVAMDSSSNLYIADTYNHRIRRVDGKGVITTIVGDGVARYGGDDGPAASASLSYPYALAFDSTGNLYVADMANNRIRKIFFWPSIDGTVSPPGAGTIKMDAPTAPGGNYKFGDVVNLSAEPNNGYRFSNWTGSVGDVSSSSTTLAMSNKDESVTANFIAQYNLTTSVSPATGGSVQVTETGPYDPGTIVHVTANPAAHYRFSSWLGGVANWGSAATTITMNGNESIRANFLSLPVLQFTQDGGKVICSVTDTAQHAGDKINFLFRTFDTALDVWSAWKIKYSDKLAAGAPSTKAFNLKEGTYQIKIARLSDGMESETKDCTVAAVSAISPDNATIVTSATPRLNWQAYPDATGYVIQTSMKKSFPASATTETPNLGNVLSGNLPVLTPWVKTYWRVVALIPTGRSVPSAARSIVYNNNSAAISPPPPLQPHSLP